MVRFKANDVTHLGVAFSVSIPIWFDLKTTAQRYITEWCGFNSYMVRFKVSDVVANSTDTAMFQFLYGSI